MVELLVFLLILTNAAHCGKGILVIEATRHLEQFAAGLLGLGFGESGVDAVCRHLLLLIVTTAGEGLHDKVYQTAQRYEYHHRKNIFGVFEIDFSHWYRSV